ncbi:NAD(P)H-hydrate dehydratase [Microbacterium sp. LWH11-1.2]|uniref:NAD(P)H-hydrate dehydratase n=1 Tax=Microbacterium sp. LWH11-1.2 TaxID=3135258 RepID=UPI003138D13E
MVEVREWTRSDTARFLRVPTPDDDKYARGVVALRTGSPAYPGAAVLGVEAAWRAGAGFVRYVGASRVADAVLARRPETVAGPDAGGTRVDVWVIGSGTDPGERSDTETLALREILSGSATVIIDAGALDLAPGTRAPFLVTPHAREFSRLRERLRVPSSGDDRAEAASQVAAKIGGTVLLKGARTLIADPSGAVIAVEAGTGWLATAGTGDVLAGALGAVTAANPGASLAEAAAAGAWLHGHAARIAAGVLEGAPGHPIVAMDVADALPSAIADVLA